MRNQTFFIIVLLAIFVQFPGCHTLSSRQEWERDQRKRIADDLELVQHGKEKDAVINWLVAERWDHKKTNDEKIAAEIDKDREVQRALKAFVVPYLCAKFEQYMDAWDPAVTATGSKTSKSPPSAPKTSDPCDDTKVISQSAETSLFDPDDTEGSEVEKHDLDDQTRSSYRYNARRLFRIFTESDNPSAKSYKKKIQAKHPNISLHTIAKNFGLAISLLHNCKHGVLANDPELVQLVNPDNVVETLKKWSSLTDDFLLDTVRVFEEVTGGK